MHGIQADALRAAEELSLAGAEHSSLSSVSEFVLKIEYEFDPAWFHGRFWLAVARQLKLTKRVRDKSCGRGHLLFFRIRRIYRRTRDFANPKTRAEIPVADIPLRHKEARDFCRVVAETDPM